MLFLCLQFRAFVQMPCSCTPSSWNSLRNTEGDSWSPFPHLSSPSTFSGIIGSRDFFPFCTKIVTAIKTCLHAWRWQCWGIFWCAEQVLCLKEVHISVVIKWFTWNYWRKKLLCSHQSLHSAASSFCTWIRKHTVQSLGSILCSWSARTFTEVRFQFSLISGAIIPSLIAVILGVMHSYICVTSICLQDCSVHLSSVS